MSGRLIPIEAATRALLVFSQPKDQPSGWVWLRLLRRGYWHVCAWVQAGDNWVLIDPLASGTLVMVTACNTETLIGAYDRQPVRLLMVDIPPPGLHPPRPHGVGSCVDAVKRLIGLRAWWVVTPYQLYRHLKKGFSS